MGMGIRPRSPKSSISPTVAAPVAGEVAIEIEASPINQYDLLLIAGGSGYRPQLPSKACLPQQSLDACEQTLRKDGD